MVGKLPWVWQIATDCLNTYPDYNKPFEVYTNASDYQLGAAIIQDKRPIAYWSRSLQSNQLKYTTTEKELLAIILCLNEYKRILYEAKINIYTNHKNLTFKTLNKLLVIVLSFDLKFKLWYLSKY